MTEQPAKFEDQFRGDPPDRPTNRTPRPVGVDHHPSTASSTSTREQTHDMDGPKITPDDRRIVGCHCGYRAHPDDHGYGDSVVRHLLEVAAAWASPVVVSGPAEPVDLDLAAVEARAAAATPGPWVVERCSDGRESISAPEWDGGVWVAATEDYATDYATEDAEFIAHARSDVPALVAEVKRLRDALDSRKPPTDQALTKLHDRAHRQPQSRVWRIVDWLVHSLDAERLEKRRLTDEVERLRLDLGAIAELTWADRPYDWRLEQIRVITAAAARSALDGAS